MASAEFVERVAEWQSFYAVLAGASATFAGLLFVSLSVNPALLAKENEAALRLARHTFGCFIYLRPETWARAGWCASVRSTDCRWSPTR